MRVLFVSQEFPPETGWGGIGTYVDVLSEALGAKGNEVHVLSIVPGQDRSDTQIGGVTVHRRPLPLPRGSGRVPPESWRRTFLPTVVARDVRRLNLRPTVIECPEWMAEGLALTIRPAQPVVVRLHSSFRQLFPYTGHGTAWRGFDRRFSVWLEETSARRANLVISTRSNLDEVADPVRLDHRALHAIPYPVRLPPTSPMPTTGPPTVTFVGRLEARKGPEILLRAMPAVLEAVPGARVVFVGRDANAPGTPPLSAWLRSEARRLGVEHALELTGQLNRDGVNEQLRRATVCAFPSRWESFGNVVAEAAATGRPVVVSAIPPFRELVEDGVTGRIVPLDQPKAWARALVEFLLDREQSAAMGNDGASRVNRISAPDRVADLTIAAYEHAVERWRRGQRAGRTQPALRSRSSCA